jgi:hypothetical protein
MDSGDATKKPNDKCDQLTLRQRIAKHKKSCLTAVCLVVVVVLLVIVWAHNCPPDHFMSKYKLPWSSPDYKLREKNHKTKVRRSDNKEDNWSKQDFLDSVSKFNRLAAVSG